MGFLSHFLYPWGLILQGLAVVHFIRRRPDNYWIFVILFLGPIGAAIYLFAEVLPDFGLAVPRASLDEVWATPFIPLRRGPGGYGRALPAVGHLRT